ncbi:hypothetical protein [Teredinibacter haidensis]|uniref:hypothetical protein n=1 Tax=Teredinibacter haidensis TaxID=2731755 RepID=UPI000948F54A|nr:hypothetical protein [Teredinibacter haidensis]
MKYFPKKYYLAVIGLFIAFNAFATKIAPISIEELLSDSSVVTIINVKQASLSVDQYEVIYSGEKKNYLNHEATIVDPIKAGYADKTIKFLSRKPLLVNQEYLVFLNSSESGELFVAQAGFAAFEKTYISFAQGIKESIRVPSSYISLSKDVATTPGVTKLNEQSSYVWAEWLPFKKWMISHLDSLHSVK